MLEQVADVETIITDTEKEALIIENNLIKEYRPRYNVKLRDDKNYPCLKLSTEDEYPTLCIVRQIKKDHYVYFGPYPSATSLRETLRADPQALSDPDMPRHEIHPSPEALHQLRDGPVFGSLRRQDRPPSVPGDRSAGPEILLEGKNEALIESPRRRDRRKGGAPQFSRPRQKSAIRSPISIGSSKNRRIVSTDFIDQDVIGLHRQDHTIVVHPLFIRAGKLLGGRGFTFPSVAFPEEEVLGSFLHQYYREGKFIPDQILLPAPVPDLKLMEEWFTDLKGKTVRILVPVRGEKKHLLDLACQNAEKFLRTEAEVAQDREELLELLKEGLHLTRLPRRIEAFDMSNLQGRHAVGSMVVFENGKAANERYRHYKIKSVEGADDYGMMYEVLLRRYTRALEENDLPDLVLVDGGKGQMNIAQEVFKELHIRGVDLVSLAKERPAEGAGTKKPGSFGEKVFHPQFRGPLTLGKHSPLIHLLDRIRDEAHRFAITYHKKVRSKGTIKSALGDIPGIGRVRQRALLKHFGSLDKVGEATLEELAGAPKMNSNAVQKVYEFFHPDK